MCIYPCAPNIVVVSPSIIVFLVWLHLQWSVIGFIFSHGSCFRRNDCTGGSCHLKLSGQWLVKCLNGLSVGISINKVNSG